MRAKEFIPVSKPRNFVAKNQKTAGAGAHKDKKRAEKQGDVKHKQKQFEQGVAEGANDMTPNWAKYVLDQIYNSDGAVTLTDLFDEGIPGLHDMFMATAEAHGLDPEEEFEDVQHELTVELEDLIKGGIEEGWKDEGDDFDEWSKYVKEKLTKAAPDQRLGLAKRLSQIEIKNFGSSAVGGFDRKTGKPTAGLGLTDTVRSALRYFNKEQDSIRRQSDQDGAPGNFSMPFGSVDIPGMENATPEELAVMKKAVMMGPEVAGAAGKLYRKNGTITSQDLKNIEKGFEGNIEWGKPMYSSPEAKASRERARVGESGSQNAFKVGQRAKFKASNGKEYRVIITAVDYDDDAVKFRNAENKPFPNGELEQEVDPGWKFLTPEPSVDPNSIIAVSPNMRKTTERVRDPEDWDEGNTEPGNNFAVYINGKKWKVFPGPAGAYADSPEERREFQRLKDMAARKSAATGKKWEVYITGEPATK
jgi:hypothetical protein